MMTMRLHEMLHNINYESGHLQEILNTEEVFEKHRYSNQCHPSGVPKFIKSQDFMKEKFTILFIKIKIFEESHYKIKSLR